VHSNTKIDRSSRLQVGVPGWLRTGHSSEHIIIGARDNTEAVKCIDKVKFYIVASFT